jgi:hypothetical protein
MKHRFVIATLLTAGVLLVGGCTQGSQTTQTGPTPSASRSGFGSASFGGRTPTGVQLGHLLTHAQLPSGWQPLTGAGPPVQDSGQSLRQVYGPQPSDDGCLIVNSSAVVLYFTDWWSVSDATLHVQGGQAAGDIDMPIMDLTVAAFRPADEVAKTLSKASHVAATCASFNDHGEKVTVSSAPVPRLGSQGLYIKSTEQSNDGPIVAQVALAQVGGYVVGADTDNATSSNISRSTVQRMVSWLARQLPST